MVYSHKTIHGFFICNRTKHYVFLYFDDKVKPPTKKNRLKPQTSTKSVKKP